MLWFDVLRKETTARYTRECDVLSSNSRVSKPTGHSPIICFHMAYQPKMVFIFLSFCEKSKEEFVIYESYIKFKFQSLSTFFRSTATLIH